MKIRFTARQIVYIAAIAAIYTVLTITPPLNVISFGPLQLRIAEALTVLPIFTPFAVPGLFIGCILSNLMSGYGLIDIVFGSVATLIAAYLTYKLRAKQFFAMFMPVVFNAVIVSLIITVSVSPMGGAFNYIMFFTNMGTIAAGEALAVYALGYPLSLFLQKKGKGIFK